MGQVREAEVPEATMAEVRRARIRVYPNGRVDLQLWKRIPLAVQQLHIHGRHSLIRLAPYSRPQETSLPFVTPITIHVHDNDVTIKCTVEEYEILRSAYAYGEGALDPADGEINPFAKAAVTRGLSETQIP